MPPGFRVVARHQHIHARKEHEDDERQADFAERLHLHDGKQQQEGQRQKPDRLHKQRRVRRRPQPRRAHQRGKQLADQRGQNPETDVVIQRVGRAVKIHRPAVVEQVVKDGVASVVVFVLIKISADAGEKCPRQRAEHNGQHRSRRQGEIVLRAAEKINLFPFAAVQDERGGNRQHAGNRDGQTHPRQQKRGGGQKQRRQRRTAQSAAGKVYHHDKSF